MQNNITVPAASKRRVIDAFTQALHALMAVSFALAYITSEVDSLRLVHVTMGYTLGAVFVVRVLWGGGVGATKSEAERACRSAGHFGPQS